MGESTSTQLATDDGATVGKSTRRRKRKTQFTPQLELDYLEIVSLVCKYFCKGMLPSMIVKILKKEHRITMQREQPYRYIKYAAEQGWFHYAAPPEYALRDRLKERYRWLERIRVAHTATFDDVAYHTAQTVLDLLESRARRPDDGGVVHIGFAGGGSMRRVARILGDLLRRPTGPLPKEIVFHALVAGFDVEDPTTDPNAFFTYFVNDAAMPIETKFVGLHAPPVCVSNQFEELQKLEGIEQAFARKDDLDIIVTSGGSWRDECAHSMLAQFMKKSEDTIKVLERLNCVGDLLWRPLNEDGPITEVTKIRAMTLIELTDLPRFIKDGKSVVLMLGPCLKCMNPRPVLLKTILDLDEHLITHLVTDTRTAAEVLGPVGSP